MYCIIFLLVVVLLILFRVIIINAKLKKQSNDIIYENELLKKRVSKRKN